MQGTLRTFDERTRAFIMRRVTETAEAVAKGGGAEAMSNGRQMAISPFHPSDAAHGSNSEARLRLR
jgi:metal-dependent amidase/aminoacylase/carboxypeptidase family protein